MFRALAVEVAAPLGFSSVWLVPGAAARLRVELVLLATVQTFSSITRGALVLGFPLWLVAERFFPRHMRLEACASSPSRWFVPHAHPGQCLAKDPLRPTAHPRSSLLRVPCASASGLPGFLAETGRFRAPLGFSPWCGLTLCAPAQARCALLSGVSGPESCPRCYSMSCFQQEVKFGPCYCTLTRVKAPTGSSVLNFFCARFSDTSQSQARFEIALISPGSLSAVCDRGGPFVGREGQP